MAVAARTTAGQHVERLPVVDGDSRAEVVQRTPAPPASASRMSGAAAPRVGRGSHRAPGEGLSAQGARPAADALWGWTETAQHDATSGTETREDP